MPHTQIGGLLLDSGTILPDVTIAYETYGQMRVNNDGSTNAILVDHALTGDAHLASSSDNPEPGWWEHMVGPGKALDTNKFFVVATNVLGGCQGSTGPASTAPDGKAWGSRFPLITVRDMVRAEAQLANILGIRRWYCVIGASAGGHRTLEWGLTYPQQVDRMILIATSAATTADQAAWIHPQLGAIEADPHWHGGDYANHGVFPSAGLAVARQIAHVTYRSAQELNTRFGRFAQHAEEPLEGGRLAVQSYLDHHGKKLVNRFDAGSYVILNRAMLTHDTGRDRAGCSYALAHCTVPTLCMGIDSDRLYPAKEVALMSAIMPWSHYCEVSSLYGHDGFLIETTQVETYVRSFLKQPQHTVGSLASPS
ncbi:MAG: homoserine O-acetyltransferase [Actinomycetaceae bacterium]|nr:homoserine O-acetyltransferase [Actinomycetaceae bacterium]